LIRRGKWKVIRFEEGLKKFFRKKSYNNPAWGYGVTPHPQAGIASSQMRLNLFNLKSREPQILTKGV